MAVLPVHTRLTKKPLTPNGAVNTVTYDGDDITSITYNVVGGGEETVTFTYSIDGYPIFEGIEYKKHVIDIFQGIIKPSAQVTQEVTGGTFQLPPTEEEDYINETALAADHNGDTITTGLFQVSAFQFIWDGTLLGTIDVEVSNTGNTNDWTRAYLEAFHPAGEAGSSMIELQTSAKYIRAIYKHSQGSGDLKVHVHRKSLG